MTSKIVRPFAARIEWLLTSTDNPSEDPQVRGDAFKTLFVSRLSYDAKEADLEREFGRFGPIERVQLHAYCAGRH
jgi:RNA recognition motif-containing protein